MFSSMFSAVGFGSKSDKPAEGDAAAATPEQQQQTSAEEGQVVTTSSKVADTASRATLAVTNPVINHGEKLTMKVLHKSEDLTRKAVIWTGDKTEELTEKALGAQPTAQLKTLGTTSIEIGTTAFHRMGGIADQFAELVEETANGLVNVGKEAGEIVTSATGEKGAKVKDLAERSVQYIEDSASRMTVFVGEGTEEYFSGTRTDEERQLLLKDSGSKDTFGEPLVMIGQRGTDGVPRFVLEATAFLEASESKTPELFKKAPPEEEKIKEWTKQFDEDETLAVSSLDDAHLVAALLHHFFAELPQPLFLNKNFALLCKEADPEQRATDLAKALAEVPPEHFATLQHMLNFASKLRTVGPREMADFFGTAWLRSSDSEEAEAGAAFVGPVVETLLAKQTSILTNVQAFKQLGIESRKLIEAQTLSKQAANAFVAGRHSNGIELWNRALHLAESVDRQAHSNNPLAEIVGCLSVAYTLVGDPTKAQELTIRLGIVRHSQ